MAVVETCLPHALHLNHQNSPLMDKRERQEKEGTTKRYTYHYVCVKNELNYCIMLMKECHWIAFVGIFNLIASMKVIINISDRDYLLDNVYDHV